MTNNLDALLTALYVKSELVTLAVAQALLGFTSESRWLRFVDSRLGAMFPYVPRAGLEQAAKGRVAAGQEGNTVLAVDTDFWFDNH